MRRVLTTLLGSALLAATMGSAFAAPPELLPSQGSPSRGQQLGGAGAGPGRSLAGRGRVGAGRPAFTPGQGRGPGVGAADNGQGGRRFNGDRFRNADRGDGYGGDRHRDDGAAVGAGVAGLAAGALIGGALANRDYGDDDAPYSYGYGYPAPAYAAPAYAEDDEAPAGDQSAYCARRYRSYDPESGTYLGFDGERHPCP